MQTVLALLPTSPSRHHLRWVDRLSIGSICSAAIRLAQSVALSGTASIIVVAAQHCVIASAFPPPRTDAPKSSVALAEGAFRLQPELPEPAVGMSAPVAKGSAPAPLRPSLVIPVGRDAGRTRPTDAWVSLPPRPQIRAAADHGVVALVRNAVAPEPASSGLAATPRLVRTTTAAPLPPLRATLAETMPAITPAPRNAAPPIRIAAGVPVTAGRSIVLARVTVPTVPPPARHPSNIQILVEPVRYGLGMALGMGKFIMATNDRLILGTADAIGSLVR